MVTVGLNQFTWNICCTGEEIIVPAGVLTFLMGCTTEHPPFSGKQYLTQPFTLLGPATKEDFMRQYSAARALPKPI